MAVVAFALAGCAVGGTKTTTVTRTVTRTVTTTQTTPTPSPTSGAENARYFGTPVSITKLDATRYALVLKPEFFLVGVTANVVFAAQQQNACAPLECPAVEDDRLVISAGSRKLLFVLPAATTGTVLTLSGGKTQTTSVTAAQLAGLLAGAKTPKLLEPLESGLWLSVDVDKVTSFAQQFQP